ncbi:MAG TPA: hypothetical protein VJ464_16925 [Blastocatellia bacterium]|nr:hypothetical protein [Blastocatellia bacterium]
MTDQVDEAVKQLRKAEDSRLRFLKDLLRNAGTLMEGAISRAAQAGNWIDKALAEGGAIDRAAAKAQSIVEGLQRAIKTINEMKAEMAKSSEVMYKHGWWVINDLPMSFYRVIIAHEGNLTAHDLTQYIVGHFNSNECQELANIVQGWDASGFSERKKIFEDALWAHKEGKYTLTVPTLIIQIEGIIREFIKTEDAGFTAWRFETVKKRFTDKFVTLDTIPAADQISLDDVQAIANYHNLAMLERIYVDYNPSNHAEPGDVNRHAVSHGLWLTYSTVEASTRLILLLDMLHSMLKQLGSAAAPAGASVT